MGSLQEKIQSGELIPFIGMGVFYESKASDGSQLPYDSDSMILALNNGRAMSERLMYEYSRAAMSLEQRKGREFIIQVTNHIYASKEYELPFVYQWLRDYKPKYIVDTNVDDSICKVYEDQEHIMITGVSRIMADYDRFVVYKFSPQTNEYEVISKDLIDGSLPIIFKPMGCMIPNKDFIISDADFVDWLTEAMGGYAMPSFLKEYKKDKEFLYLGMNFDRDTFRMVAHEITLDCKGGYLLTDKKELTKKEDKFITTHNLELIDGDLNEFLKDM
jgi:hypothetical protein